MVLYINNLSHVKKYETPDGSHKEKVKSRETASNIMFASLNACRGNARSRRDDIEAALYLLIYLLNKQSLPWSHLANTSSEVQQKM